jgi:epoxide hydrolase-like predicted phosphatase
MWRGQISDEEFLSEITRRHPEMPDVTAEEFLSHTDVFQRSEPVYALAKALREYGIITGILSNVFGIGLKVIERGGFYEGFDPLIISCREGLAKPDVDIYKLTLERTGVEPQEMIYIDDQSELLEPAKALGIHTVLATAPDQIVADVKAIIAKENDLQL